MLRVNATLLVILNLCIVNLAIGHPGTGYGISRSAKVDWEPSPTGQGPGTVYADTSLSFHYGTHNEGDAHADGGHTFEGLQHRGIFKLNGEVKAAEYWLDTKSDDEDPPSTEFVFDHPRLERSAEQCFDVFAKSAGYFRWGTKIYNETRTSISARKNLPDFLCNLNNSQETDFPWEHEDAYNELRQIVADRQLTDSNVTGAVNRNGLIYVIRNNSVPENFNPVDGIESNVIQDVAQAPSPFHGRRRLLTVTWASLKK